MCKYFYIYPFVFLLSEKEFIMISLIQNHMTHCSIPYQPTFLSVTSYSNSERPGSSHLPSVYLTVQFWLYTHSDFGFVDLYSMRDRLTN